MHDAFASAWTWLQTKFYIADADLPIRRTTNDNGEPSTLQRGKPLAVLQASCITAGLTLGM